MKKTSERTLVNEVYLLVKVKSIPLTKAVEWIFHDHSLNEPLQQVRIQERVVKMLKADLQK